MDMTLDPDPDEVETPGGYGLDFPYTGVAEDGTLTMLIRYTIDLAGQGSLLDASRQATLVLEDVMCNDMTKSGDEDVTLAEGSWTLTFPLEQGEIGTALTMEELRVPATDLETRGPGPSRCGMWRSPPRTSPMSSLRKIRSGRPPVCPGAGEWR